MLYMRNYTLWSLHSNRFKSSSKLEMIKDICLETLSVSTFFHAKN